MKSILTFSNKLVLLFTVVIIIILSISIPIIVKNESDIYLKQIRNEIELLAKVESVQLAHMLDIYLEKVNSQALLLNYIISEGTPTREQVNLIIKNIALKDPMRYSVWAVFKDDSFDNKNQEYIGQKWHGKTGNFSTWWHDMTGKGLVRESLGNFLEEQWYIDVDSHDGPILLDPYTYTMNDGEDIFLSSFSVPITIQNKTIGYTGTEINWKFLSDSMSRISIFDGSSISFIASNQLFVYHPDGAYEGQKLSFKDYEPWVFDDFKKGKRIEIEHYSEYLNSDVFDFFIPVKPKSIDNIWYLRVTIPIQIIDEHIKEYLSRLLGFLIIIIIVLLTLFYVIIFQSINPISNISRNLDMLAVSGVSKIKLLDVKRNDEIGILSENFNSLVQSLQKKESMEAERGLLLQRVLDNEKKLEVTLNSIGDGIIVVDKFGYVARMNPVAQKLTGWTIEKANGKSIQDIFNIIDCNTGKKQPNPLTLVFKTGEIQTLENHTVLISKNADRYHIADSAAPILDDNGNIQGAILNFRDVSDVYKRKELLRREKISSDLAHRLSKSGTWYIDYDKYPDRIYGSKQWFDLLGISLANNVTYIEVGRWKDNIISTNKELGKKLVKLFDEAINSTDLSYNSTWLYLRELDKKIICITSKIEILRDKKGIALYVYGAGQDITEFKNLESKILDN